MSDERKIKSFRDLDVWQKSHQLTKDVFSLTDGFPRRYLFDLTAQLRRAALSIPTNIAEGCASSSSKELLQFVNVSKRSVSEVQYLLFFAFEQALIEEDQFHELDAKYEQVNRMLGGLRRSLRSLATRHSALITRDVH